jgi:hypothetical protein
MSREVGRGDALVAEISEQITDQIVYGAKFVDEFRDAREVHWVLTRAPLDCVLDATESVILSYRLEIEELGVDVDGLLADITAELERARGYHREPSLVLPADASVDGGFAVAATRCGCSFSIGTARLAVSERSPPKWWRRRLPWFSLQIEADISASGTP